MWIKLISPRVTMRPMDSDWKVRMAPPLSLLVLAALTPESHRVTVVDENVEPLRTDDHPDLVGITVKVDTFYRAAELAARYRARGIPVVMGGIHPTVCPDACLLHCDAVVVGEAERLWPRLLGDLEQGALEPVYRNVDRIDPSETPLPRWDLIREKDYLFTNTALIGRGCPWRCDFCYNSSPNVDANYRMKPIPRIRREIEALGVKHVMFIDDNFIGNPAAARRLLQSMRGMMVNASLVFGFDGDTPHVFPDTLEWLIRNRVETMTCHILTPYPGTRLHRQLTEEGRIVDDNLEHYNTARAVFLPRGMSRAELEAGYLAMYKQFYRWDVIRQRMPLSPRQWVAYLEFNLLYRKFGRQTARLGHLFGMRRLAKLAKWTAYRNAPAERDSDACVSVCVPVPVSLMRK